MIISHSSNCEGTVRGFLKAESAPAGHPLDCAGSESGSGRESESGGQLLGAASPAWAMRVAHTRHGMTPQVRLTFHVRPAVPARPGPGFSERPRGSGPLKKLDDCLWEVLRCTAASARPV